MSAESDLANVFKTIVRAANRAEIAALKALEGSMKARIHNQGGAEQGQIGRYSLGYARKRRKAGRQTAFIDLQFTGELASGYTVGKTTKFHNALGFTNDAAAFKARKNEEVKEKAIFAPTDDEFKEMDLTYIGVWTNVIKATI